MTVRFLTELISGTFPETIWALQLELMNLWGLSFMK